MGWISHGHQRTPDRIKQIQLGAKALTMSQIEVEAPRDRHHAGHVSKAAD
jgi:peptide methionine sulfoxide reductase MsrB